MRNRLLIASLIVAASISFAADRVTVTGRVTDNLGQPLENATVMVYHAGVKTGYSTYCPGCFRDCGKRTLTDRTGSFTIKNLDSDLWFELLVVRDGYTAGFVERVDPLPMDQLKRRSLRHEPLLMISVASSVAEWWINTADRCVRP